MTTAALTPDERDLVRRSLRSPRGRYDVTRASQLSGVPRSTVYEWAREGVLSPDYPGAKPKTWSYRDLVLLRLTVWLRSQGMAREIVVPRVARVRQLLGQGDVRAARVRADARHFFLHGDIVDDGLDHWLHIHQRPADRHHAGRKRSMDLRLCQCYGVLQDLGQ